MVTVDAANNNNRYISQLFVFSQFSVKAWTPFTRQLQIEGDQIRPSAGGDLEGLVTIDLELLAAKPQPWDMSADATIVLEDVVFETDTTGARTPDLMASLENQLGKDLTSRSSLTVSRILTRMG